MKNNRNRRLLDGTLMLAVAGATLGLTGAAQAQRDPGDRQQSRQERRQRMQNTTPEERQRMWEQRRQNMTPEQRQRMENWRRQFEQEREAARWEWVRQVMAASGYTDKPMQDAVIAFMQAQEKARQPLLAKARSLSESLVKPEATDEQFKTDMAAYREAVAKDRTRHEKELAELDKKIKYSTQPRLEMLLTVLGIVGYETPTIGGIGAVFPDSPFGNNGMRGMGRMRGGERGGGERGGDGAGGGG